jgi:cell wall-associated NlpC family hydrolase
MKKTLISAAVMLAMGASVAFGTSTITEHQQPETVAVVQDEAMESGISAREVAVLKSNDEAEAAEATEVTEAEEVTEETTEAAPECEYPEWQEYAVANIEGSLRVRAEASTDAEIVGKLYPYAVAHVVERGEEWSKVESGSVSGYVANEFLMFGDEAGAYITENYKYCASVEVPALNVRQDQSTESECIGSVTGGQELDVLGETDEWVEIQYNDDTVGYVAKEFVEVGWNYPTAMTLEEEQAMIEAALAEKAAKAAQTTTRSSEIAVLPPVNTSAEGLALGQQIASYACQFVGNPYVYGGSSLTNGTDCSGFTMAVYAQFGYSLSHSSAVQMSQGTAVSLDAVQPGDIICYSGHVGLYIGGGQIVHASTESTGIIISNMYYTSPIGARRIVQ